MDPKQWEDQYSLDCAKAKLILAEAFPELLVSSIKFLGSGWDFNCFEINAEFIFRFPRRDKYNSLFNKELEVMKLLSDSLPILSPDYSFISHSSKVFPNTIGGYKKIEGAPIIEIPPSQYATIANAKTMGDFLTTLHSLNTLKKIENLSIFEERSEVTKDFRDETKKNLEEMKGMIPISVWNKFNILFEKYKGITPFLGKKVLTHNDLGVEHIICGGAENKITGIIDWTDMAIGDPAADFACIWASNRKFYHMVVENYSGHVDKDFEKRVEQKAIYTLIGDSLFGYSINDQKRISWSNQILNTNFKL